MELVYRHLAVSKFDTDPPEKKTHTLTFREGAPVGSVSDLMLAGGTGSSLTFQLTEVEAMGYLLGRTYSISLGLMPEAAPVQE